MNILFGLLDVAVGPVYLIMGIGLLLALVLIFFLVFFSIKLIVKIKKDNRNHVE
ncbi:MAG: hypothetical protein JXR62_05935 [Bacilli bacterium]|nr:hypothetical protein [Bacilli bacterium]